MKKITITENKGMFDIDIEDREGKTSMLSNSLETVFALIYNEKHHSKDVFNIQKLQKEDEFIINETIADGIKKAGKIATYLLNNFYSKSLKKDIK